MSYTVLRVSERGVVMREAHRARLGGGPLVAASFDAFCRHAPPGIYRVTTAEDGVEAVLRPASQLGDGQPVRWVVSPFVGQVGAFAKPPPPSPYEAVRQPGVTTLLTDAAGQEIYESANASVVAWDGHGLVLPPEDRPRVASLAEAFVASRFKPRRVPIPVNGPWALLLVNAVRVAVPAHHGRDAFPAELRAEVEAALEATASRPSEAQVRPVP